MNYLQKYTKWSPTVQNRVWLCTHLHSLSVRVQTKPVESWKVGPFLQKPSAAFEPSWLGQQSKKSGRQLVFLVQMKMSVSYWIGCPSTHRCSTIQKKKKRSLKKKGGVVDIDDEFERTSSTFDVSGRRAKFITTRIISSKSSLKASSSAMSSFRNLDLSNSRIFSESVIWSSMRFGQLYW